MPLRLFRCCYPAVAYSVGMELMFVHVCGPQELEGLAPITAWPLGQCLLTMCGVLWGYLLSE